MLCVRWYLRYCLTLRDLEELMAERGLGVDHSTIGRWVLRYAPELNKRIRRDTRTPNRSWRVDETYVRVAGAWTYLYRAVDSTGETIDFMLSPKRDAVAAKHFLQMALWRVAGVRPRVIKVDGHAAYPQAIRELKASGELARRCRCRPTPYLNNVLEQDHRFLKRRMAASLWFRSIDGALRTIAGHEAMKHDPKRTNPLAGEGRHRRSNPLHRTDLRARCVTATLARSSRLDTRTYLRQIRQASLRCSTSSARSTCPTRP